MSWSFPGGGGGGSSFDAEIGPSETITDLQAALDAGHSDIRIKGGTVTGTASGTGAITWPDRSIRIVVARGAELDVSAQTITLPVGFNREIQFEGEGSYGNASYHTLPFLRASRLTFGGTSDGASFVPSYGLFPVSTVSVKSLFVRNVGTFRAEFAASQVNLFVDDCCWQMNNTRDGDLSLGQVGSAIHSSTIIGGGTLCWNNILKGTDVRILGVFRNGVLSNDADVILQSMTGLRVDAPNLHISSRGYVSNVQILQAGVTLETRDGGTFAGVIGTGHDVICFGARSSVLDDFFITNLDLSNVTGGREIGFSATRCKVTNHVTVTNLRKGTNFDDCDFTGGITDQAERTIGTKCRAGDEQFSGSTGINARWNIGANSVNCTLRDCSADDANDVNVGATGFVEDRAVLVF